MASAAQIEANRKNAQKSTGPITPEGKAKSGQNSIRHGMLCRVIPMDAPGYRELLDGLYTSLTPQNELQRMMVDQIAITTMRLRRIWGAEQSYLYTKAGSWQDGPDTNQAAVHNFLEVPTAVTYLRYELMLNRLLARLLRQYHAIRSDESWARISQSDCPYIQEQVAEQPAKEAPSEQQAEAAEDMLANSVPPSTKPATISPPALRPIWELGGGYPRAGGAKRVAEDAPPETEEETLSTIGSDIEARIEALAKIPYNEFVVQSRVAAYDAHQRRYGAQ